MEPPGSKAGSWEVGGGLCLPSGDLGYPGGLEGAGHWPCAFLGCSKPIPFGHLERTRPSALCPESAKQLGQSDLLARPTGGSYCTLALCLEALLTLPSYPLGGHLSLGIKDGSVELWLCPLLHVSILAFRMPGGLAKPIGSAGILPREVVARRAEEGAQAEGGDWEERKK